MYQYKARKIKTREIVAEGHTIDQVLEHVKVHRKNKDGANRKADQAIEIVHTRQDSGKEEIIKVV